MSMEVLYEDNHIIIVNKASGEIVQGDKTGDRPLSDIVKDYTSKALTRLNAMFASKTDIQKTYWAIVSNSGKWTYDGGGWKEATHWLVRNEQQNKSYAYDHEVPRSKKAVLRYRVMAHGDRYTLLEVQLLTGRHHQIRCQLAALGSPIKGDLKYGAKRSNPDGSISLHARRVEFVHPVSKELIKVEAPVPTDALWKALCK